MLVSLEKLVFESQGQEDENFFMHECLVVWAGENFLNFLARESESRFLMHKAFSPDGNNYFLV